MVRMRTLGVAVLIAGAMLIGRAQALQTTAGQSQTQSQGQQQAQTPPPQAAPPPRPYVAQTEPRPSNDPRVRLKPGLRRPHRQTGGF